MFSQEIWKNYVDHTNKLILDWNNKCIIREVELLIILLESDTESSESEVEDVYFFLIIMLSLL